MTIYDRPTPETDAATQPFHDRSSVISKCRRLEQERDALMEALESVSNSPATQPQSVGIVLAAREVLRAIKERK